MLFNNNTAKQEISAIKGNQLLLIWALSCWLECDNPHLGRRICSGKVQHSHTYFCRYLQKLAKKPSPHAEETPSVSHSGQLQPHLSSLTIGPPPKPNVHVFGLWLKTGEPSERSLYKRAFLLRGDSSAATHFTWDHHIHFNRLTYLQPS